MNVFTTMTRKYVISFETSKWYTVEEIAERLEYMFEDDETINVTIDKYQGCSGTPPGVFMSKYSDVFPLPKIETARICTCQSQRKVCTHGNVTTWNTDDMSCCRK